MKKAVLLLLFLTVSAVFGASSIPESSSVLPGPKGVTLLREGRLLYADDLTTEKSVILHPASNFEKQILFTRKEEAGKPVVELTNRLQGKKTVDTAFSLKTKPLPVKGKKTLLIRIRCRSNLDVSKLRGGGELVPQVIFFDAAGKKLGVSRFHFTGGIRDFTEDMVTVPVLKGSASAVVIIGADGPNIKKNDRIAFSLLEVSALAGKDPFCRNGWFISRPFPLRKGTHYLSSEASVPKECALQFQISTAPDRNGAPGEWSAFRPLRDDNGKSLLPARSRTEAWIRYKAIFTSSGKQAPLLKKVCLGTETDADWTLLPDTEKPVIRWTHPSPTVNYAQPVTFSLTDSSFLNRKSVRFTFDGMDRTGDVVVTRQGTQYTGTFDHQSRLTEGIHTCTLEISDIAGNRMKGTGYLCCAAPQTRGMVTVRKDGMTLIDGKPLFVIGIYAVTDQLPDGTRNIDTVMANLRKNGFNTLHTYQTYNSGKGCQNWLDTAGKYGFKVIIAPPKKPELFMKARNDQRVLAWYLADDTHCNTPPQRLLDKHLAAVMVDASHLTCHADTVGLRHEARTNDFAPYADICPSFLPELYPVQSLKPEPDPKAVPAVMADMDVIREEYRKAGGKPKNVWAILQYFEGWTAWKRYPTCQEERAMVYAAVVHGAAGITWYTYHCSRNGRGMSKDPEHYETLAKISRELGSLQAVLASPIEKTETARILEGPAKNALNGPSVTWTGRTCGKERYIFAVNSSLKTVKAEFRPGIRKTVAEVLTEQNRKIPVRLGAFTDTIEPYGVRIYRIRNKQGVLK